MGTISVSLRTSSWYAVAVILSSDPTTIQHLTHKLKAFTGNKTAVDAASAVIFFAILAALLSAPFLFLNQAFYLADMTYNNEPVARFLRETWQRTGHLPLWNPFVLCGVAQIQVLWPIAYMPGYIFLLLPMAQATGVFLSLHYVIAGSGAYVWQYFHLPPPSADNERSREDRQGAAVLLGLTFMLCGYMTSCTVSLGLLAACVWIPWILFLIDRATTRPSVWLAAVIGFVAGQQVTSGRPELVALSWLLYLCYFAFGVRMALVRSAITARLAVLACAVVAVGFGLAVLFAIVDLLPMVDLVRSAPEVGSLATLGATYWKAGWCDFLTVLLSQPLGDLNMTKYHLYPTHPGTMPYVSSLYLGAPVLTLAMVGFFQRDWRERWFWLVCCIVGVGASTGILSELLSHVRGAFPDFLVFRFPIKASVFVLFALCVGASEGWKALACRRGGSSSRPQCTTDDTVLLTMRYFWLAVSIFGLGLLAAQVPELVQSLELVGIPSQVVTALAGYRQLPGEVVVCGLSGLAVTILCLNSTNSQVSLIPRRALVLLIVAGLLTMNGTRHLWKTVDASFFDVGSDVAKWMQNNAGRNSDEYRVLSLLPDPLPAPFVLVGVPEEELDAAFMQYARSVLKPNSNIDFGIQLSNGASTIPTWTSYFISTGLIPRSSLTAGIEHPAGKSDLPLQRWCQASSTRYILTALNQHSEDGSMQAVPLLDRNLFGVVRDYSRRNVRIYEVPNVRPRWSLVRQARAAEDFGPALKIINRCDTTGFDPAKEVVITDFDRRGSMPTLPGGSEGSEGSDISDSGSLPVGNVTAVSLSDNKLVLAVDNAFPSYLVVSDSFDPGWEARDNGARTKIYLANGLSRAVYLTPGKHEVVFAYKPRSLFWGEIISKVTLILIGLLVATAAWPRLR